MNNDDTRKRKAAQAPNVSSKKHKTNTATTSRVILDAPTRPATRSTSKLPPASPAQVHSTHRRDPSPGPSQSTADTHRTRFKTGSLKPKKRFRGPSEDRTLPSTGGGLSQWAAETQREKLRYVANSQSSSRTSHTKKRSRAPHKPPPKPEEIIVISSDDDDSPRPRKRLRRHTTQVSEIIDLTKDETPPPPRPRPARLRPAPTPTTTANLSISASSSSPSKYLDLRRLPSSYKSKPKATPPHSQSHSQTKTSSWPLPRKLPATKTRRQRLTDKFNDDEERDSPVSKLSAIEVVINKRNVPLTATSRAKFKTLKTEPEPEPRLKSKRNLNSIHAEAIAARPVFVEPKGESSQKGRMFLSKELRARLQDEEEEEENETSPPLPLTNIAISGDANMDAPPAQVVIKTEDIEDAFVDRQSSTPSLVEGENMVVIKEEPQFDEPSSIADQMSLIHEQEQNDMEEAILHSMLVASAMEAGAPLADQEGGVEEQDGFFTVPVDFNSSTSMVDASTARDPTQPEAQVTSEEAAEKGQEADHEGVVTTKDSEVEKVPDKIVPERPLCPPTTDINPYLDHELIQQEQADLEEALFQSQLAIVYSPQVSRWEDEDKSGMEEQEQDQEQEQVEDQVNVAAPPTLAPAVNLTPCEEDVFVTEDPDDNVLTTNEALTLPVPVTNTSTGDQITHRALSNDITETKDDDESIASLTVPLPASPLFSCSAPTTAFARFVPAENTSNMFVAGQLTQRFFAQSCLLPKAKTGPVQPVAEGNLVMEVVQMAEPAVEVTIEETQEKMLTEVLVQSVVEEVLVQSEEIQSPDGDVQVEKPVEEVPVWSEIDEMPMPAVLDADVLDVGESEVEGTVEQYAEVECRGGNEDEAEEGAVLIPPSGDADNDVEIAVLLERDSAVHASPAPEASGDEDIWAGVGREVKDVLMELAVNDDAVLLQPSEDDVVTGVTQEAEDELHKVETISVVSPQTTEDSDMVKLTLQPESVIPPATVKVMTTEALEKDPILSRALRGSRMLLELIRGVINKAELEPAVETAVVQFEEADDGIVQSPRFQTSTSGTEALPPFLPDDESHSPKNLTSEPLVHPEDTDDDTSWRPLDVLPSPLQVAEEELTSELLAEIENSGNAPHPHEVFSSARAQTSTPEPSSHEFKDVIILSSRPFESPRPTMSIPVFLAQDEGASVVHNCPLEVLSSPSRRKIPPEPPLLVDEVREDSVTVNVSNDESPLPLTSIYNSPFQSRRQIPIEDGGQPCVQSTVLTGGNPSTTAPQRRTMSNTGSESSLATSDDSPPPSTPPQSAFEAYYIRSTSPGDGLGLDIFSKVTDIPSLPLPQSDEEDNEYLLSLDFVYPDFDIAG